MSEKEDTEVGEYEIYKIRLDSVTSLPCCSLHTSVGYYVDKEERRPVDESELKCAYCTINDIITYYKMSPEDWADAPIT